MGEDGPTHQPIETLPSLRLIPDLTVMRPADGNETAGAYKLLGSQHGTLTGVICKSVTWVAEASSLPKRSIATPAHRKKRVLVLGVPRPDLTLGR